MLLRQDVVRAGLKKPATGAGITDASFPHGHLYGGTGPDSTALSHLKAAASNRISAHVTVSAAMTIEVQSQRSALPDR